METHPLSVHHLSTSNRFKQCKHEIGNPMHVKAYFVAPSSGGKSSACQAVIRAVWDCVGKVNIFATTVKVDPSFGALPAKARKRCVSKGLDPGGMDNEVAC